VVDTPISKLPTVGGLTGDELTIVSQLSTSVTITGTTISALASDNSFNDSANGFIAAGFGVDDYVFVEGFTGNVANNIFSAKITALTTGKMTIGGTDGDVIVDDAAGESVTITKWVSRRAPYGSGGGGARTLIAETVTTGSATNVQFASIAATYRDLEVRVRGRGTTAATLVNMRMRFNGDTGANYDHNDHQLNNTATAGFSSVVQTSALIGNIAAATAPASVADFLQATVADYRGTTFQKAGHWKGSIKTSTAVTGLFNEQGSFWWRSTSAINQVDVFPTAGGFVDGTVVSLYGLT
jgi:hypothetical protein